MCGNDIYCNIYSSLLFTYVQMTDYVHSQSLEINVKKIYCAKCKKLQTFYPKKHSKRIIITK